MSRSVGLFLAGFNTFSLFRDCGVRQITYQGASFFEKVRSGVAEWNGRVLCLDNYAKY